MPRSTLLGPMFGFKLEQKNANTVMGGDPDNALS